MKSPKIFILTLILICFSWAELSAKNLQSKAKTSDLVIEPKSLKLGIDEEHELRVYGGKPPYVFKTSAGMIRYSGNTAIYLSPADPIEAVVTVKDATGATRALTIQVTSEKAPPAHP